MNDAHATFDQSGTKVVGTLVAGLCVRNYQFNGTLQGTFLQGSIPFGGSATGTVSGTSLVMTLRYRDQIELGTLRLHR